MLGPLGLALGIMASFWISSQQMPPSLNLHADVLAEAGASLALRAQAIDDDYKSIPGGRFTIEGLPQRVELVDGTGEGVSQSVVQLDPSWGVGSHRLRLSWEHPDHDRQDHEFTVGLVDRLADRRGTVTIAGSYLQWADETDEHPEGLRLDLRPHGRLLAGFDNEFLLRVTDPDGEPLVRPIKVTLRSGEFADRVGREADAEAPVLIEAATNQAGLLAFHGELHSQVLRLEVQLGEARRRFRFVSYGGGTRVHAEPEILSVGEELELRVEGLSRRRAVYVDLHDPRGAWVSTSMPPPHPGDPEQAWRLPTGSKPGLWQVEAYPFVHGPGESSAIARVFVRESSDPQQTLEALTALVRSRLDMHPLDPEFDAAVERRWLKAITEKALSEAERAAVQHHLLGTLPVELYGPPVALNNRAEVEDRYGERKRRWTEGVRWFLWLGGAVYMMWFGRLIRRDQEAMLTATAAELERAQQEDPELEFEDGAAAARRDLQLRGLAMLAIVGISLVLTVALLEKLVWEF